MQTAIYSSLGYFFVAFGILLSTVLLYFSRSRNSNNIYLSLLVLGLSHALLTTILIVNKNVTDYPFLLRTGNISGYLLFPLLWLYVRTNLLGKKFQWKKDGWLALPSLFYCIDMLPFFLSSAGVKQGIFTPNLNNTIRLFGIGEGWLTPAGFHYIFRSLWGLAIYALCIYTLYKNRGNYSYDEHSRRRFYTMLAAIVLFMLPLAAYGIIGLVAGKSFALLELLGFLILLPLALITICLIFSPSMLYGFLPNNVAVKFEKNEEQSILPNAADNIKITGPKIKTALNNKQEEELTQLLERAMAEARLFTQKRLSINDVSKYTGIPVYMVSAVINSCDGCNFKTWLNRYRIRHFLDLRSDEANARLTTEALAEAAGFTSRSSFYAAFKKEKGMSPTDLA